MRKSLTTLLALLLITGLAAAQTDSDSVDPGWIDADHPLYFVENQVIDRVQLATGLKAADEIAQEKAAEARQAAANGQQEALEKALKQFNRTRQRASGQTNGLTQAVELLQEIQDETPEEADKGLRTALENMVNQTQQQVDRVEGRAPNIPDNMPSLPR